MTVDDAISRIIARLTIQKEFADQQIADMSQQIAHLSQQVSDLSVQRPAEPETVAQPKPDLKIVPGKE